MCCTCCTRLQHAARSAPASAAPTRLHDLLRVGRHTVRRRSTVFVVSDFISEPGWEKPLGQLAQRHEVVAVRLLDPLELELPDLGLIPIRDAETGEQLLVDTHDAGFRQRFARIAAQREAELRQSAGARRRGHAGAVHRRRPGRRHHALHRPAQAPQPRAGAPRQAGAQHAGPPGARGRLNPRARSTP